MHLVLVGIIKEMLKLLFFSDSDLKSEFIEFIGKYLDEKNDSKILAITPFDTPQKYRIDTPKGEYIFLNIESLRAEIKKHNEEQK